MSDIEARSVDDYSISLEESPEGFKSVILSFKCSNGSVDSFAFPAPYAHKLSDELCTASIRAAGKSTGEALTKAVLDGPA